MQTTRLTPAAQGPSYAGASLSGGSSYANALANSLHPAAQGALRDLEDRLTDVLTRAHENATHLRALADRLVDPQPPQAGIDKAHAEPADAPLPQLRRLEHLAGYLAVSMEDLTNEVQRLERL